MDGIHDLGGKHGHGKVEIEGNEPTFHGRWEAAVFAMNRLGRTVGAWNNTDMFRHAVERIDPVAYLSHGYYGRWLGGIETLLVEAGVISQREISDRALTMGAQPDDRVAARPAQPTALAARAGAANDRPDASPPRYQIGDAVLTSTRVKNGHTRLPAYARGKSGVIHSLHNTWVYPDTSAHGLGEQPQHVYTVCFSGTKLWGGGDPRLFVYLDLFEDYLQPESVNE